MPERNDAADIGARLLDAHVAFELRKLLDPTEFERSIVDEVDRFLALAAELTLSEAMTPGPVRDVARKYAAQIPVEGAIPELVGEIARLIHRHSVNDEYRLADVIDDRQFDDLATAVSELGVTRRVLRRVLTEPATVDTAVEVVTRAVDSVIDGGRWRGVARPVRPAIDSVVAKVTRSGASFVLRGNEADAEELLLDSARGVWRANRDETIGVYRDLVTEDDLDDIVVLVFEFWREFRTTPFLQQLLDEGVDHVFEKYGDTPLSELLGEVGVFREDLIEEALRFGPPVLQRLHAHGFLDDIVRSRLAGFYQSAEFRAAL